MQRTVVKSESFESALDELWDHPWSDGLPAIPATPAAIDAMVAAGVRRADEVIGTVPGRETSVEVWQAATCAVMAGCKPEYFPVVLATWEAMLDRRVNVHSALTSTGGSAIAAVVSGPYAEIIGMNAGKGLLGPGNRANSTIGRAIRLGAAAMLKANAHELDASAFGHGGKYSFHFAERTPPESWPSLREQLGFRSDATSVTVLPAGAPRQIVHRWNPSADELLHTLASAMKDPSKNTTGRGSAYMIVLGPEHADVLAFADLTPADVSGRLSELSKVTKDDLRKAGIDVSRARGHFSIPNPDGYMLTARPEHVLVVTAGGHGAGWSVIIPSFTGLNDCHPGTRAVRLPGLVESERSISRNLDFG
jgi:hypothetical protein